MRHVLIVIVLAFAAFSCAQDRRATESSAAPPSAPPAGAGAAHQIIKPEQMNWKPAGSLPPGAQVAVLEGDPARKGYFAMRLRVPDGYRIPPHSHPNVERLTVISGTFNLGMGERFDQAATQPLPAGSYTFMQPGMKHFAWARGETVVQLTTIGPWEINYVNPADDPRGKSR